MRTLLGPRGLAPAFRRLSSGEQAPCQPESGLESALRRSLRQTPGLRGRDEQPPGSKQPRLASAARLRQPVSAILESALAGCPHGKDATLATEHDKRKARLEPSSYRPIQLATAGFLGLVVTALTVSALLTWQEQARLELSQKQLQRLHVFERAYVDLELTLVAGLYERWPSTEARWKGLRANVENLIEQGGYLDPDTPAKLRLIRAMLTGPVLDPRNTLLSAARVMWQISEAENAAQESLLKDIHADTVAQLRLEILVPPALLGFGVFIFLLLRRHILDPLYAVQRLLARLADGDLSEAPDKEVPPLVQPLYTNFNHLAQRLGVLETAHREREQSLERSVRTATRKLLEQQRSLARAERLAATGELAASFAHEIRNPLAGIQMALGNLRDEVEPEPLKQRVDQLLEEILRVSQILTHMLDSSRHQPDAVETLELGPLVQDLFAITRYQIPHEIELSSQITDGTTCNRVRGEPSGRHCSTWFSTPLPHWVRAREPSR